MNKMYESLCSAILDLAENTIPKKTICVHSKGWWNNDLGKLSKRIKKAKRLFSKRSTETNYKMWTTQMTEFKELEK